MNNVYIYEWCKKRGYFGRTGDLSHVLLDKGVLCVPDNAHDEFLSEYARGVVKGGKFSCVVEYKPKIFRMFYDLDIVASNDLAEKMTNGDFSDHEIFHAICGYTADLFDISKTEVTMCISNKTKKVKEGKKIGIHLTFSSIFVSSSVALHVRDKVLENLSDINNQFINGWDKIIDSAVFKGSGMRLPWSCKPEDPTRVYVPVLKYVLERGKDIETVTLDVSGFSAIRNILASVSLRTKGVLTNLIEPVDVDLFESPTYHDNIQSSSLKEYEQVISEIEKAIPAEYNGKITGVIKTEYVYMFRHSSKYCANVQRQHHSSNTYFLVTKKGMYQCCYSRKVIFDEEACPCHRFRGELLKLPSKVLNELFPDPPEEPKVPKVLKTPEQSSGFTMNTIQEIALKPKKKPVVVPKKKKSVSKLDLILSVK